MMIELVLGGACALTLHSDSLQAPPARASSELFDPSVYGLLVRVPQIGPAVAFYRDVLGFELCELVGEEAAMLRLGGFRMWLNRADGPAADPAEAAVRANLMAGDLERLADAVRAAGGTVGAEESFPLGHYRPACDPWGNPFELLDVEGTGAPGLGASDVALFNLGLSTTSYETIEPFLSELGFIVFSRDYLPTALPYELAGSASLVAHASAARPAASEGRRGTLLLEVADLDAAVDALRRTALAGGIGPLRPSVFGRRADLRSPSGIRFRLLERSSAQLAFERIRALAGSWNGASTVGWEARIDIEVIARGSVVLQRSNFAAHPGETMVTAFHRDGPRLVLTHYCVAGNQPHLAASEFADDELEFSFASGTNLASRDDGHMDSVRYRFEGADAFRARWSWYQNGSESWMEDIRYTRAAD